MPESRIDLDKVARVIRLAEKHELEALTVEMDGLSVAVRGISGPTAPRAVCAAATPDTDPGHAVGEGEAVVAPMVGVFYRSAGPDQPAFIEVGDEIEKGATVGLLEAMKVYSEIPSDVAGVVVSIPAVNGQLVRPGQTLVVVAPSPTA